ncbi:hypothetical protein FRX31_002488 [Thalictrum thalictroides]|uniref:F-box domain-containing protein n=1 Tax=Thalictrum thalictroides TaxID=46969 RepID=A0A7J6XDV4_THATH|nr:hypothetical protein FRX31_002488 [Thalictrum thalictroides]
MEDSCWSMVATDYPMNMKVLLEKLKKWSNSLFSDLPSNIETSKVRSQDTMALPRNIETLKVRSPDTMADWSGLPKDLVESILERLGNNSILDCLRFSAVCMYWRSIAVEKGRHVVPRIMLMVHNKEEPDIGNLCSLSHTNNFQIPVCNVKNEKLYGSLNGFLIKSSNWTDSKQGEIYLYNPVTGGRISLPSLRGTTPPVYIEKAIVASASSSTDDFIVVVSEWPHSDSIHFCKEGDEEWSLIATRMFPLPIIDITYYKCKLYAIFIEGIEVYDLQTPKYYKNLLTIKTTFPDSSFYELLKSSKGRAVNVYVVTTPKEELLMVTRYTGANGRTVTIKVLKLCEDHGRWNELQSLGDQVVFLGMNSVCLMAHDVPECEANSVYFFSSEEFNGKSDTGVFNMKDGSIKQAFENHHDVNNSTSLKWFTPNLLLKGKEDVGPRLVRNNW